MPVEHTSLIFHTRNGTRHVTGTKGNVILLQVPRINARHETPDVAKLSQRHRVYGQDPDSDEPTRPVTQCEDERIVIDDSAIG